MPLVDIENLTVSFPQHEGLVQAVRGMTLRLEAGESLGRDLHGRDAPSAPTPRPH
jgi:ABC-type glutathione transport system ATPase component